MEYFKLNNGLLIPKVGIGTNTFGKINHQYHDELSGDFSEALTAIKAGYRFFDTAIAYRTEKVVGDAIKASKIPRSEFFISTKIPNQIEYIKTEETIKAAINQSLKNLSADYIDLFFIHHPWDDLNDILRVYHVLESMVDSGIIKSIGVSNFNIEQLTFILENTRIKPVSNQIQSNPSLWNHQLIDFCKTNNILPIAWSPLKYTLEQNIDQLTEIGKKYNKNWAQVLLRFQIQRDVCVIPKSHNYQRQLANLDIFDFQLSSEDINIIYNLTK